jgi:fructose-1,6-bisphosphatase III
MSLIETEEDIISVTRHEELSDRRQYVYDTDIGKKLNDTITDLKALIKAYRDGILREE